MSGHYKKAIYFDLDTKKLQLYHPKHSRTQAYGEIKRFLAEQGFQHRQWSGYHSSQPLTTPELMDVIDALFIKYPWLEQCVNKLDATNIGKSYDLLALRTSNTVLKPPMQHHLTQGSPRPSLMARLETAKENVKERDAQKQPSAPEKPLKPKKREPER